MSPGRTIRLDALLRQVPSLRWRLPLLFTYFLAIFVASVIFGKESPTGPSRQEALTFLAGMWVIGIPGMEILFRTRSAFELQLLPGAIRLKTWQREVMLIEPEIVGGRISRYRQEITLRSGDHSATICLGWFPPRGSERAAIIEHCSQFLSPEQQAEHGRDWADRYYRAVTPFKPSRAKPNFFHMMIALAVGFGFFSSVIAYNLEYCIWLGGPTSVRYVYLGLFGLYVLIACLMLPFYVVEHWRRKLNSAKA